MTHFGHAARHYKVKCPLVLTLLKTGFLELDDSLAAK